jgi:uncharacterized membrane protein
MIQPTDLNDGKAPGTQVRKHAGSTRTVIKSFKAKADKKRSFTDRVADWLTESFGSMTFLMLNVVVFLLWIVVNTGMVPYVKAFDPYPFGMLTTAVSLEAIFLAVFVLISQNRAARVDALREEIDLQVNMIAEREITKILELQVLLLQKQGIDVSQDRKLQHMLKATNPEKIEKILEEEMGKV